MSTLWDMELTKVRETDGTIVACMRGEFSLSRSLPHLEDLVRGARRQDTLIGLLLQPKGSGFNIQPGDGPAIATILSRAMMRYRKGAILAVVCADPLNYLRHQEIHRHMELSAPYAIRAFLDEESARNWLGKHRKKLQSPAAPPTSILSGISGQIATPFALDS